jgi:hypothetical protein
MPADFDYVRRVMAQLPGAEESTSYGTPSFKVRKKFLCRLWPEDTLAKHDEAPEVLVVVTDSIEEKAMLIETTPKVYFSTPHYDGHPHVLVRLNKIKQADLADLLEDAWNQNASKTQKAQLKEET